MYVKARSNASVISNDSICILPLAVEKVLLWDQSLFKSGGGGRRVEDKMGGPPFFFSLRT